jgi:outer membrane protein OmpA-like peptidoglycan-associated protein
LGVFILIGAVSLSGCATKNFVLEEIAPIEARVSELESTDTEHAERIDAVDQRAQEGISQANTANTAAAAADSKAESAGEDAATADRKAEAAQESADQAMNRLGTVENRLGTLYDYSVTQTVTVTFGLESAALSDEANGTLDGIAGQVQDGDFVEVQGYTDSTGEDGYNIALSDRRAQAVKRYLVSKEVPLFRIEVVGLGEMDPAASNDDRAGREQNRRVEVRILRAGS